MSSIKINLKPKKQKWHRKTISIISTLSILLNLGLTNTLLAPTVSADDTCSGHECDMTTATILAQSIVCDSESDLPNWGASGTQTDEPSQITANTANEFLSTHPNCHLAADWNFNWTYRIGNSTTGGGVFTTSTTETNPAQTQIPVVNPRKVQIELVEKSGYTPFLGPNNTPPNPISAELYCHDDIVNFDNDERFIIEKDNTYHCLAFNALEPQEPVCGNEIKEEDEQCDDGNTENNDGCSANCKIEYDFGDAPSSYKTLLADNGAQHQLNPNVYLGSIINTETDGQPSALADADSSDDGVVFTTPIKAGTNATIEVTSSIDAKLSLWIDYNSNGEFKFPLETVFLNNSISAGTNTLTFSVPAVVTPGNSFARFRLSTEDISEPTGLAQDGEVEDYIITFLPPSTCGNETLETGEECDDGNTENNDGCNANCKFEYDFGDAPSSYKTLLTDNGAQHLLNPNIYLGSTINAETDGQPSLLADADSSDDGVTFTNTLIAGSEATIEVTSSANAKLSLWIDYNTNGEFKFPLETVFLNKEINTGTNTITFNVPAVVTPGNTFARFRLSTEDIAEPTGLAQDGEVEDYGININLPYSPHCGNGNLDDGEECDDENNTNNDGCSANCKIEYDFGDAPSSYKTLLTDNGAQHLLNPNIFLGSIINAETDGQPDPQANFDTSDDGIIFQTSLIAGSEATIEVTSSANAKLSLWIDYNANGEFKFPLETVFLNKEINTGTNTITFNVPAVVTPGNTFARFRLSTEDITEPTGLAQDGEVEDYLITTSLPSPAPICGDGIKNQTHEECDGTDGVGEHQICNNDCILETLPYCGDGTCNSGESCSSCSQDCGSCGRGGGGSRTYFKVKNPKVKMTCDSAIITWSSNKKSNTTLVYGEESINTYNNNADNYGYEKSTETNTNKTSSHTVIVNGITPGTNYYFRGVSTYGSKTLLTDEVHGFISKEDCTEDVIVLGEEGSAKLVLTKTVNTEQANQGDKNIEYVITLTNNGNMPAFNINIKDLLPEGLSFIDTEDQTKTWTHEVLAAGDSISHTYKVNVNNYAEAKIYKNVATVTADNHQELSDNANITVNRTLVATGFSTNELIILLFLTFFTLGASRKLKSTELN